MRVMSSRAGSSRPRSGRPRPVLTGRALGLGALVVLLVVVLASPIHRYLASRTDITTAERQLQEHKRELSSLKDQVTRYGDPGYIQQQARERLQYAMPGDTVYVVVDKGQRTEIEKTRATPTKAGVDGPAWNDRLMSSVRAAGR